MTPAELSFLILSRKKTLIKFALGSSITYGAYVGAIRPSNQSSIKIVDGSDLEQGKNRDYIKLAKAPITQVQNALELDTLKNLNSNQNRFHPSLAKYLINTNISEKQRFNWEKANVGTIKEAISSEEYCLSCATLSDKEITYGDTYFSKKVGELSQEQLVQDILWSLWEESQYNGTLIHTESIKVDLELNKEHKTTEVKQFALSFKISNLNAKKSKVFRSIDLDPYSQTEVVLLLSNAELRATPVASGWQAEKYTTWNLFPKNTKWKVIKNVQQPKRETTTVNYDSLQLIFGESRFISSSISRGPARKIANNTVDYPYIKEKLTPYLNQITAQQVKEDIENWYGGYVTYLLRSRIEDFKRIIELMEKKTIENDKGIKQSVFEQVLNNYQFRNNLYSHFRLSENYKKVLNRLLTNEGGKPDTKGIRINIEEVIGLIKSWIYQLEQIRDSIRVEIKWIEQPRKVYSQLGKNGQFPHFAFSFEQKIIWTKDMTIPLKGKWNHTKKVYESTESTNSDTKYPFNITNKLINLQDVLTPLTSLISAFNGGKLGNIDIMKSLIPDVGRFIGIEKLKVNIGEAISYTYKTNGTPITLALDETADLHEKNYKRSNIGWKALDVSVGLNLSKFTNFFYTIYEKFDLGIKDRKALGYTDLTRVAQELQEHPISFIAHAINSIFDENYKKEYRKEGADSSKPWPVFFKSLLESPLVFENSQMLTGYSKLFFEYHKEWGIKNKEKKESSNCKITVSTGTESSQEESYWCTSYQFKEEEIAKPKTPEIENIARSLMFNHSMYLPDAPIILNESVQGDQYSKFLEGVGKSSIGLVNNKNQIIQAARQEYDEKMKLFKGRKVIDWTKAKVSFAQLNLKKAIESVLAQKNTWSDILSRGLLSVAGLHFHKILGEALVRDGYWININTMHEYGMFSRKDIQITKRMDYYPNSEIWLKANPKLDPSKLNIGVLKDLLKL